MTSHDAINNVIEDKTEKKLEEKNVLHDITGNVPYEKSLVSLSDPSLPQAHPILLDHTQSIPAHSIDLSLSVPSHSINPSCPEDSPSISCANPIPRSNPSHPVPNHSDPTRSVPNDSDTHPSHADLPCDDDDTLLHSDDALLHSDDADPMFDRFTSLAKRIFNVPIALVTVLTKDTFWIKSNVGLPGLTELPCNESFCAYTVMDESPELFVVEDVLKDERFQQNPMVIGPPYARFYAGAYVTETDTIQPDHS